MKSDEEISPKSRVVVDGDVSEGKVLWLVKLGFEEERLDYKNEYNLSGSRGPKDKIEFVRDVVAMANTLGGYIILGVHEIADDTGKRFSPEGMTQAACTSLDVSTLRQQVEAYVAERIEIHFKLHQFSEFGSRTFGVIFVPQSPHLPIIFTKDGQYKERGDSGNKNTSLFRSGDIVVRKGASTERADQSDMRRIISHVRRREKETWTEEILGMRDLVQRLDQLIVVLSNANALSQQEQPGNVARLSRGFDQSLLYLSPSAMYEKIVDLLDVQRDVPVRRYIQTVPGVFLQHIEETRSADENQVLEIRDNKLVPVLDGLLVIGVACIEYKNWELFEDVRAAFYSMCYRAKTCTFPSLQQDTFLFNEIWVWQEIMVRVYSLGALLVRRNHWDQARRLVQQEIEWDDYWKTRYWSRYVLTMAARANQLEKKGWVPPVVDNIESNELLSDFFMADRNQIMNAVCQFDFLQCVYTATGDADRIDPQKPYPSFGLYLKSRTEPIVSKLIARGALRDTIPAVNDEQLANLIHEIDNIASREFMMYNGWHRDRWSDNRIAEFLRKHLSPAHQS